MLYCIDLTCKLSKYINIWKQKKANEHRQIISINLASQTSVCPNVSKTTALLSSSLLPQNISVEKWGNKRTLDWKSSVQHKMNIHVNTLHLLYQQSQNFCKVSKVH